MIAKIGYAYAAAETRTEGLLPELSDIIRWKSDKSPYLIGGGILAPTSFDDSNEPIVDCRHRLELVSATVNGQPFTIVYVRLFANTPMPTYHVVVRRKLTPPEALKHKRK